MELIERGIILSDLAWYINRIKAMSIKEIIWRLQQKQLQKRERSIFLDKKISVTKEVFSNKLSPLKLDEVRLGLNLQNSKFTLNKSIVLFGVYNYEDYKKNWHAGFQTKNKWPLEFSYDLEYKQRVDIGDVRTNWELNRHFQFAILAKDYYISRDSQYLNELIDLFQDWNNKNPFLYGVSWTSIMEIAIRINSWIFCYCFLKYSENVPDRILEELRIGIINMTDYIAIHYSRFSSANNHAIVEAYVIGLSGIVFDYKLWIDTAINILDSEILLQNYSDGVNKELSLHYQAFFMEAFGLLIRAMNINGIAVPKNWMKVLEKMSRYVSNCMGKYGEVMVFGDNDEGKILDLQGDLIDYYQYVLQLMSLQLRERYVDLSDVYENVRWLFSDKMVSDSQLKILYDNAKCVCYKEGGNTILKSNDGRVLIGIDHADLGFGTLAAHGHADALSFQMFIDGKPLFIDPGTYNYHFTPEYRDYFRYTINHNTVTLNNKNQSEILGAFLWGKRAKVNLVDYQINNDLDIIEASHNGYEGIIHKRSFHYDNKHLLQIYDTIEGIRGYNQWCISFLISPEVKISSIDKKIFLLSLNSKKIKVNLFCNDNYNIVVSDIFFSPSYNVKQKSNAIRIIGKATKDVFVSTEIRFE